ncbi:hypothetical protein A0H76_2225 [Hepatospora eriocheir]|uniref:Uncharacterized protein n=1 Tax=Hepatospora eriocheir TaxID=1081669 RepID=A0A1X0QK10_9MICR|nr:hypothetical protein A0H76_2225 [Hepatospora eriocheir]
MNNSIIHHYIELLKDKEPYHTLLNIYHPTRFFYTKNISSLWKNLVVYNKGLNKIQLRHFIK